MSKVKNLTSFIPEDQKDREWHMMFHEHHLLHGNYNVAKSSSSLTAFNFYLGDINPLEHHATMTVADNNVLYPVDFINYNNIMPIIEQQNGMFSSRGYGFDVHALSTTAKSRRTQAKLVMEVEYDMLPLAAQSQQVTGMAFIHEDTPKSPQELEAKKKNYKEMGEVVHQRLLNDFVVRYNLEMKRIVLFQDANIAGDAHLMLEYVNGHIVPTMLKSTEVFYDTSSTDPLLSDARYYMVIRYMSLTEVMNRWELTPEQAEQVASMEQRNIRLGEHAGNFLWPVYRNTPEGREMLVSTLYWKDIRMREGLFNKDKYGGSHYSITDKYTGKSRKKPIASRNIEVENVRHCTMIGGRVCPEDGWGLIDWIPRTVDDNWSKVAFPIVSVVPRFVRGKQKSTVELLAPLQGLIDRCMFMIAKAMKKDHGRGTLYDLSQSPSNMELEDLIYKLDKTGILPIEARQFGAPSGYNQYQTIDLSISPSAQIYVSLANTAIDQMMRVAGITESSMGNVAGASQTVGVTQSSIMQTNVRNDWIYRIFDMFTKNILQLASGILRKCVSEDPERFSDIIGDDGVKFIKDFDGFDLEDLGVSILVDGKSAMDAKDIVDYTKFAIQNGFVDFVDGINVTMARDDKEMKLILEEIKAKADQMREQQAAAAQQSEAQRVQSDSLLKMQLAREQNSLRQQEIAQREREAQLRAQTMRDVQERRSQTDLIRAQMRERGVARNVNRPYHSYAR